MEDEINKGGGGSHSVQMFYNCKSPRGSGFFIDLKPS
jgi:hypothetical protein